MVVTTWDGHLRIDHVPDADTVALTLVTVEPATEVQLRSGLVAEFVTADPEGPPAFVAAALQDGRMPGDVAALLGPRVSAAVAELLATGGSGQWLQLDLVEVDDLAAAWAPYRAGALVPGQQTPASRGALGSWAGELWTCLGLPGWRDALRTLGGPSPAGQFRSTPARTDEPGSPAMKGRWRLPDDLAATVGVQPEVRWELRPADEQDAVEIDLRALSSTDQASGAVL
ncbi:MAG: hypothetical protein ACRDRZ_01200, partial [Pseudonocardiaceae bacterium]